MISDMNCKRNEVNNDKKVWRTKKEKAETAGKTGRG